MSEESQEPLQKKTFLRTYLQRSPSSLRGVSPKFLDRNQTYEQIRFRPMRSGNILCVTRFLWRNWFVRNKRNRFESQLPTWVTCYRICVLTHGQEWVKPYVTYDRKVRRSKRRKHINNKKTITYHYLLRTIRLLSSTRVEQLKVFTNRNILCKLSPDLIIW